MGMASWLSKKATLFVVVLALGMSARNSVPLEIIVFTFLVKFKIWLSQEVTPNMLVEVALLSES